jgi:hypothetical protein
LQGVRGGRHRHTHKETIVTRIEPKDVLPVGSRVSWGAILAGAVLALAVYFALSLLGVAIGLSVSRRVSGEQLGVGAAIYAIVALLVALFLGGYVASQATVGESRGEAVCYGVLVWGVTLLTAVWIASQGFDAGFGGLLSQAGKTPTPDPGARSSLLSDEELRKVGLTDQQIGSVRQAGESLRARVGRLDVTAEAWWSFFGVVLSMAAAVAGALTGAGPTVIFRAIRVR